MAARRKETIIPAVVPIFAAFASGAVGAVVAGTATLGSYLAVAGAALSTIGALTGKEDISKFGAVLSLGGGLANSFTGASSATATEAFRAGELANTGATNAAMDSAAAASGGAAAGAAAEAGAGAVADAGSSVFDPSAAAGSGVGQTADFAGATAEEMAGLGADMAGGSGQSMLTNSADTSGAAGGVMGQTSFADPSNTLMGTQPIAGGGYAQPGTLMDTMAAQQQPTTLMGQGAPGAAGAAPAAPQSPGVSANIQQGAKGLTANDIGKWLNSAGKWAEQNSSRLLTGTGNFLRNNKELVSILGSQYSPENELLDWRKSLMATRQRNLNTTIKLGPITKG